MNISRLKRLKKDYKQLHGYAEMNRSQTGMDLYRHLGNIVSAILEEDDTDEPQSKNAS